MSVSTEKLDFRVREIDVQFEQLFPRLDRKAVFERFKHLKSTNPHETIFNVVKELWKGERNEDTGYAWVLDHQGFHSKGYEKFTGHCHQTTPSLGLVLKVLGFDQVAYLECYRIRENFPKTGIVEMVPPEKEENNKARKEFIEIGRIPYCTLEVKVDGKPFYVASKHIKAADGSAKALLAYPCYIPFVGVFKHQDNPKKSGIYVDTVIPEKNPSERNFSKYVVWKKQTGRDPSPELFATYLRMNLK